MDIEKDATKLLEKAKKLRKGETKGAPTVSPTENKTKEELEKERLDKENADVEAKKKDADAKAKHDEDILKKKDDDKKEKSNVQKRFDELTAKIKNLEKDNNSSKSERDDAKAELDQLKKDLSKTPQDKVREIVKKEMQSRATKYTEEDKEKPREDRREMTKEELEEWRNEDFDAATEWVTRRSIRRVREEEGFITSKQDEAKYTVLLKQQSGSEKILLEKHPELDVAKRTKELETEGKKPKEIFETLCGENPKYKLASLLLKEDPQKYVLSGKGPELIAEELTKRLSKTKKTENENSELEKANKRAEEAEAELERIKSLDPSISSTRSPEEKTEDVETEELGNLAAEVGLDKKKVVARHKKREETGGR